MVFLFAMDYKIFYQNETKHAIPSGYEIHHIDQNRENNNKFNLLMLPKDLHTKLHRQFEDVKRWGIENSLKPSNDYKTPYFGLMEKYLKTLNEVNKYLRLRDILFFGRDFNLMKHNDVLELYNEIYPF